MPSKNSLIGIKSTITADRKDTILDPSSHKKKVERVYKNMRIDKERVKKFDMLVAKMKNDTNKKTAPDLIEEALDHLFEKYKLDE